TTRPQIGVPCDDGDACSVGDECGPSGCSGGSPLVCQDGDACNGAETCEAATGCVDGTALTCNDDDACNGVETCDATAGCMDGTILTCDDGDVCNGVESCAAAAGCVDGAALTCDDQDACNGLETCDAAAGCTVGDAPVCDDGNACTADSCLAASGCAADPVADAAACGADDSTYCLAGECVSKTAACNDVLVVAPEWFGGAGVDWPGFFEFGQTHVTLVDDPRYAPPILEGRETVVLFTPDTPIDAATDVRVSVFDGDVLLGVLSAAAPAALVPPLERQITTEPLDPYSTAAWSAFLPWEWVQPGFTVRIGWSDEVTLQASAHTLDDLGAPHRFTLSRAKIVMFGDAEHDTATTPATKLARDMYGSAPYAELRLVDGTDWIVDYVVVGSPPQRVTDVAGYDIATSGADRWQILKNHFTLRMNTANTGRGLWRTSGGADGSPYGLGTSIGLGWVKNDDGNYSDVNNAPWAAGWTGWTSLWLGECGNAFVHELGHSFTMSHFTGGTATNWGIADEYPKDGTNLASHPWGFDTTRRRFRTWYRVNSGGIALDDQGQPVGKRDPMNGGESSNAATCFPQYTGYHAWKAQAWAQGAPTVLELDGVPGVYQWQGDTHQYEATAPGDNGQAPIGVDVPTVTLIGTLGKDVDACQTYPPIYWAQANVFELPDPAADDLPAVYNGGQYFLELHYDELEPRRALIANAWITGDELRHYSFNAPLSDAPNRVDLYRSPSAYPDLDLAGAELLHTRVIDPLATAEPVVEVGRGRMANGPLTLHNRCTAGIDCDARRAQTDWRLPGEPLVFAVAGSQPQAQFCSGSGDVTELQVSVVNEAGEESQIVVHAQRLVGGAGQEVAVPIDDATPWIDTWDATQSLRVWLPWEPNSGLAAGVYQGEIILEGFRDGAVFSRTPVRIDLEVRDLIPADLTTAYDTPILPNVAASSSYFIVEDATMGPTTGSWWTGTRDLQTPVIDAATGELTTLHIRATKVACGDSWDFNAGQANWDCTYYAHLVAADTGNEGLVSGHTYTSPPSAPLVVIGKRWHQPNAGAVTGVFPLAVTYTAP
ncbi:MAG: hypothetical protein ACI9WU_002139, partial [Myxococcota bacterium]